MAYLVGKLKLAAGLGAVLILASNLVVSDALAQADTSGSVVTVVERVGGAGLEIFEPVVEGGLHGFFELLGNPR
jgi:hypothetical protein